MSFDLTALGITEAAPTPDWGDYGTEAPVLSAEASRGPALTKGLYIFKVPEFKVSSEREVPFRPVPHKTTKALQFVMNPIITRPEIYADRTVFGFYIPLTKSEKQKFSRGMELIFATGSSARPTTDQEWIAAAFDLVGREFGALVDLRVRDGGPQGTGRVYFENQDAMYKREDGSPKLSYVIDIASGDILYKAGDDNATRMMEQAALDNNTGRKLYANAEIKRLVSLDEAIKALDAKTAAASA